MPNDAKLGLVVGVTLVIAVAIVFFRKDGGPRLEVPAESTPAAAAGTEANPAAPIPPRQEIPALPVSRDNQAERQHVIQAGDTLYSIAKQHYGDGDEFYKLYKANRELLKNPDQLPVGQTLKVP